MHFNRPLSYNYVNSLRQLLIIHKRFKHKKDHWSVLAKKKFAKDKALDHFDDFYKNVYGPQWPSIRLALLSPHKYCAVINNFGDSEEAIEMLQNQGALNLRSLFEVEKQNLREKNTVDRRIKDMDKIFKLDKQMELIMLSKQEQEYESLYPQSDGSEPRPLELNNSGEIEAASDVATKINDIRDLSLQASLENAEFDEHRLIDPSNNISSAALYEFVPATKIKGMEDYVLESEHYGYYKKSGDFPVHIKKEYNLNFPKHLNVFTYERGNISSFAPPRRGSTGVFNYYLLDGGSVLPVLALDVAPGDAVLDMCAAPGGKSLLMLQTLYPGCLVCNDIQESRTNRIHSIFKQYLYDLEKWKKQLLITQNDGRAIQEENLYHKILVDVPCTTDRHSLHENDNNIFKQTRIKERLRLPELQAELLSTALKLVLPGGTVVYSTCSLSPVQNDGVVHMALRNIWEETNIKIEVRDLAPALEPVESVFKIAKDTELRYGHLVLPFLPCNFGPMYFCKLVRVS